MLVPVYDKTDIIFVIYFKIHDDVIKDVSLILTNFIQANKRRLFWKYKKNISSNIEITSSYSRTYQ